MRKSDQLIWWAGGNAVPRQQAQKLVILRVSVGNGSRHQHNCGGSENRTERIDSHG
jgi:hypothetical protein